MSNSGVMVALFLNENQVGSLSGLGVENPAGMHITLVYLGDSAASFDSAGAVRERLKNFAAGHGPVSGKINGIARFSAGDDGMVPVVALFDSPSIAKWRQDLVESLDGIVTEQNHGFTPHVTLRYERPGSDDGLSAIDPVEMTFDSIALAVGDEVESFVLAGPGRKALSAKRFLANATDKRIVDAPEALARAADGKHTQAWHRCRDKLMAGYGDRAAAAICTWSLKRTNNVYEAGDGQSVIRVSLDEARVIDDILAAEMELRDIAYIDIDTQNWTIVEYRQDGSVVDPNEAVSADRYAGDIGKARDAMRASGALNGVREYSARELELVLACKDYIVSDGVSRRTSEAELSSGEVNDGERRWNVTVIGPEAPGDLVVFGGKEYIASKNGRLYTIDAIRRSVSMWEGARVYDNHQTEKEFDERGGMRSLKQEWVGVVSNPEWDAVKRRLTATVSIVDDVMARKLLNAWNQGVLGSIGVSMDVSVVENREIVGGKQANVVTDIAGINSLDFVAQPAAGGRINRMATSAEGSNFMPKTITECVNAGAREAPADQSPPQAEVSKEVTCPKCGAIIAVEGAKYCPNCGSEIAPQVMAENVATPAQDVMAAMESKLKVMECRIKLKDALADAHLPPGLEKMVRGQFDGVVFTDAELSASISRAKEAQSEADGTGRVVGAGASRASIVSSPEDNLAVGVARFLMGDRSFRAVEANVHESVQERVPEFYRVWQRSGRHGHGARSLSNLLWQTYGGNPMSDTRAYEAISRSSLPSIMTDTLNLMLAIDYSAMSAWYERIVIKHEVSNVRDATLAGVYGLSSLSAIEELGPYTDVSLQDSKQIATFQKFGNKVMVSLETMMNDDLNVIQSIPRRLSDAWSKTLSDLVRGVFSANSGSGPTLSDTGALFNAVATTTPGGHANLRTGALSFTEFAAARTAMMKQTDQKLGAGQQILIEPKYLLVPPDLETLAAQIVGSEYVPGSNNNDINPYYNKITPIVVPGWGDATDWALVADPLKYPSIYLVFPSGGSVPTLTTADSPNAGSMFERDAMEIRVRAMFFVQSGQGSLRCAPVVDHRPLHKNNVAG